MNVERLLALADILDRGGVGTVGFDMHSYYCRNSLGHCGSTACIAGHAVLAFGTEKEVQEPLSRYGEIAARLLGFDDLPALFFVYDIHTPYEAAWVIRAALERDVDFEDFLGLEDLARKARRMRLEPPRYLANADGTQSAAAALAGFNEDGD